VQISTTAPTSRSGRPVVARGGGVGAGRAACGRRYRRTGEVEQPHLRPWATVLKAPTTRGLV
jgi:hypothetical protein